MPVVMVFIDGLGVGSDNAEINPVARAELPFIKKILPGGLTKKSVGKGIVRPNLVIRGIDARLEVPGIPQSATGQTALFTGVNAARITGRHINGFPTKALRTILEQNSIFKRINQSGRRSVFANTFTKEYFEAVERGRWRNSASTTAALAGECRLLMVDDLIKGYAVYQDIINEQLRQKGYQVPLFTPEEAAVNLVRQATQNDFTLFEYFQTDRCGHAQDRDLAIVLLNRLDSFLATIVSEIPSDFSMVVTSDHGNIDDLSIKTHTLNQAPLMVFGPGAEAFAEVDSLVGVCPTILKLLGIPAMN